MKNLNTTFAVVAFVLAILAVVVNNPKENEHFMVDVRTLAKTIEQEEDHILPDELAGELQKESTRWKIFDLRDAQSYQRYHIPQAERIALSELIEAHLPKNDTVILYSEGGLHAVQGWMLLAAKGYHHVFSLQGGLAEWNNVVRFPVLNNDVSPEIKKVIEARAKFFGGSIQETSLPNNDPEPKIKRKKPSTLPRSTEQEEDKFRNEC